MSEWETYLKNRPATATEQDDFEAGQAAAEQRVKDLEAMKQHADDTADEAIAHAEKMEVKVRELERERDAIGEKLMVSDYELRELKAQAGVLDGWQPIETAPKDGREVVLAGFNINFDKPIMSVGYFNKYDVWQPSSVWATPTHWMPLPAAPKEQG